MTSRFIEYKIPVTDGLEAYDELGLFGIDSLAEDEAVFVSVENISQVRRILKILSEKGLLTDSPLDRYIFRVKEWLNSPDFNDAETEHAKLSYIKGYPPRRTANEILYMQRGTIK